MIKVALVDDQTLVRAGIRSLLGLVPDIQVVGEGENGDDAVELAASGGIDVLLLDLRMPPPDGIAALETLAALGSTVPILVLTTFDDDELVLRALRAGARGFMMKDVTLEQLTDAVRVVAGGGSLLQPILTERLFRAVATRPPAVVGALNQPDPLTDRELEVLRLAAAGYSNAEIAEALHLATGTVKNHLSSVFLKLGVHDRTRAVLRALDQRILG